MTFTALFPVTAGAYNTTYNGGLHDAFVAKLSADGTNLRYATYLGGRDEEKATALAVNSAGDAYIVGWTASKDFPTTSDYTAHNTFQGGDTDVFAAKLNSAGTALEYALYVGGSDMDLGLGLALDAAGYAYLTGYTESSNFPWRFAVDYTLGGQVDAFVAAVRPTGNSLFSSTYLGGSSDDIAEDIALDAEGNLYVTGTTNSTDFPVTAGAYSTSYNGGNSDVYVAKLDHGALHYATFLGGSGNEMGEGIAVDGAGSAYITGDLGEDAITKLNPAGSEVDYTFTVADFNTGDAIAVDAYGGLYILGYARYNQLPTTPGAFNTNPDHIWLAKISTPTLIRGRVTDSSGQPLAGIRIAAGGPYSTTTGASGAYTLTLPAGKYSFATTTPGYLWSPAQRTATVPPDATGQDFVGRGIDKQNTPGSARPLDYGDAITYTVRMVAPEARTIALHDRIPTHTTYITGSLVAPAGVSYDPLTGAISGTLSLTANLTQTVTFQTQVAVTGTASLAPLITNRACVHPPGSSLVACEWSNEVVNRTYLALVYLPLIMR